MSEVTNSSNTTVTVEMQDTFSLPVCRDGQRHRLTPVAGGYNCALCGMRLRAKP